MTAPRRRSVVALALAGVLLGAVSAAAALAAPFAAVATPYSYVALGDSFSAGEGIAPFLQSGPPVTAPPGRTRPGCGRRAIAKPLYAIASGRSRAGAGGGANLYGSDTNVRSANRRHVGDLRVLGRDDGERPAAEPRRRAAGSGRPLRRQDADRQRRPGPRQPGHAHARWQRRRLRRRARHLRSRQLQHARVRAQPGGDHRPDEAAAREGLPRDRGEGAARPHPRPRLSPSVPGREGTAGLPRAEPVPGASRTCCAGSGRASTGRSRRRLPRSPARGRRITFVPVAGRFEGHEVCGSKGAWINGIVTSSTGFGLNPASFHPTLGGQRDGYGAAVNAALRR